MQTTLPPASDAHGRDGGVRVARWERPLLLAAAAHAAVWAVLMWVVPERVFASLPRWPSALAALVAAEALCLACAAFLRSPWIVGIALAGKALGPFAFLLAVRWGWEPASAWPWVLINDVIWVLPLAVVWRRRLAR